MALADFSGDLVRVDLTSGQITRERCPETILRQYLGGRGLVARLLLEHLPPDVRPLDPENMLIISAGLLSGTNMITSGRVHIGARSPLTTLLGCSNGGGFFGAGLKACGILALIVVGKAEKPVFIHINNEEVAVKSAIPFWGLPTGEARSRIREAAGDDGASVILIGPAGEGLSPLGCIVTDSGHAAGRTGMGAVMGSKNLKAVVAGKATSSRVRKSEEAATAVKEYTTALRALPCWEEWSGDGSSASVSWTDQL
ncbi:MAG: aldehyde ferredoxin oxidoreductase, partial [Firmicutes bacterium]|nr:aldehyde ferredoxin oxidoreductase [Bacillota bacterium]